MSAKSEQVDARMAALTARFGDRLSAEELGAVRSSVEGTLDLAAALRSGELDESVEPTLFPAAE